MPNNTTNYNLVKPLENEYYDINVQNGNMDIIDRELNINKTDITNIQNDLSVTENSKYTTVNGIKEFECKDGYVDNVIIEGKTLVNSITPSGKYTITSNGSATGVIYPKTITPIIPYSAGTKLTFKITVLNKSTNIPSVRLGGGYVTEFVLKEGTYIYTSDVIKSTGAIAPYISNTNSTSDSVDVEVHWVIEGDYIQNPPSNFEGLKSIGQGDKIEVLTYGEENPIKTIETELGAFDISTGNKVDSATTRRNIDYITVKKGVYKLSINSSDAIARVFYYDSSKVLTYSELVSNKNGVINVKEDGFINIHQSNVINDNSFYIFNENCKYDKKQILSTLRSLPNGVKDVIYKQGDKYYKIKRCEEMVLDSNLSWEMLAGSTNTLRFVVRNLNYVKGNPNSININCDKLQTFVDDSTMDDKKGICSRNDNTGFNVRVLKTDLSTQDLTSFKTWLNNNPITVVYELVTPTIEEIPNFNPRTFDNKSTILLNTGVVQGEASFDVTNSTRSELEVFKGKSSNIEEGLLNNLYSYQKYKLTKDDGMPISVGLEDINNIKYTSWLLCSGLNPNRPSFSLQTSFILETIQFNSNYVIQRATSVTNSEIFVRCLKAGVWQSWQKVSTTSTLSLLEQQVSELEIQAMENEV